MSIHTNLKQDKCWSCEFYCAERKYKDGFIGDSVNTADKGTCMNDRSQNHSKMVFEHGWCSKYQKWGVLQSSIAQKKATEQLRMQQLQQELQQETAQTQASETMHSAGINQPHSKPLPPDLQAVKSILLSLAERTSDPEKTRNVVNSFTPSELRYWKNELIKMKRRAKLKKLLKICLISLGVLFGAGILIGIIMYFISLSIVL